MSSFLEKWWSLFGLAGIVAFVTVLMMWAPSVSGVVPLFSSHSDADCDDMFGGPYPREGNDISEKKKEDFRDYNTSQLSYSRATKLVDMEQFEGSIRENLPFPYGVSRQKYNYAISEDCDILVATWKDPLNLEDELLKEVIVETETEDESLIEVEVEGELIDKCPGGRDFTPRDQKEAMINWFPEEAAAALGIPNRSPCWLNGNQTKGLLDAISKHFMLAQGPGTTIDEFNSDNETRWAETKVAFAGEITVDLDTCSYWLNSNSGTYKPLGTYLPDVNQYVAKKLGSMKISNVAPWCP